MSTCISQMVPNNKTVREYNQETVKTAICKQLCLSDQETSMCGCDVQESSNLDCCISEHSDNEYVADTKKKLSSSKNSCGDLVEKIGNNDQVTEKAEFDCAVPKQLIGDCCESEESSIECVEENDKASNNLTKSYGNLVKNVTKSKVTENSVFISGSSTPSNFDTIRKLWHDRMEHLNKLTKKKRLRVILFLCSFSFNIMLIILICFAATKNKRKVSGYVEPVTKIPSVKCEDNEFKNFACWSCSLEETFKSSRKVIQKFMYGREIICCGNQAQYVQSLVELMNNEQHRIRQITSKRQTQSDVPVAIHVELSQRVSKDGSLNWKTPFGWKSSINAVGTISQSKGVFKIPVDGLYTLYESLITKFINSSSDKNNEYIHVRIHKNSGRTTYKVLIQRNLKRWTGLQVYQGTSSMASFYLQKGDDVEVFISDSDLILYKSKGINHFGIYKH